MRMFCGGRKKSSEFVVYHRSISCKRYRAFDSKTILSFMVIAIASKILANMLGCRAGPRSRMEVEHGDLGARSLTYSCCGSAARATKTL